MHIWVAPLFLTLIGCVSQKPLTNPLPYHFTKATFVDERSEEDRNDVRLNETPFNPSRFTEALKGGLPRSIFSNNSATLHVTLQHYEITRFNNSYALSIVAKMSSNDAYGRKLASHVTACSEVGREGFALVDYATQLREEKDLRSLTSEGRASNMWQKLYNTCVHSLISQYAMALETDSLIPDSGSTKE